MSLIQIKKITEKIAYSGFYTRLIFDYFESRNLDAESILDEPAPPVYSDEILSTPSEKWKKMLNRAATFLDDPQFGLHLGQSITPSHMGVLGYVLQSCPNAGVALMRWQEYEQLVHSVSHMVGAISGNSILLQWTDQHEGVSDMAVMTSHTAFVQYIRHLTGRHGGLERICFMQAAPANLQPYDDFFQCEVVFNHPLNTLLFSIDTLGAPLVRADAALQGMMERQAKHLLGMLAEKEDVVSITRVRISELALSGEVSIERVASAMKVTPRNLQRQLALKGWKFRDLCNNTLCALAKGHLSSPALSIKEIAWLLGYSEPSAFTRAFKSWTGQSPLAWRFDLTRTPQARTPQ